MNYQSKNQLNDLGKVILEPKLYQAWNMREIQGASFPEMEIKTKTPKLVLYLRWKKADEQLALWRNDPERKTMDTLSSKSINALNNYGIKNKKQALKAYQDGDLHPSRMRNYGWKSHQEVCEWLGVEVILENPEKKEFCSVERILSRLRRRLQIEDEDAKQDVIDEIKTLERWTRIIKSKYSR